MDQALSACSAKVRGDISRQTGMRGSKDLAHVNEVRDNGRGAMGKLIVGMGRLTKIRIASALRMAWRDFGARLSAACAVIMLAALSAGCAVPGASAQDAWWESIQGGGATDFSNSGNRRSSTSAPVISATRDPLNDLRTGPTPWRSDIMLNATAAAIEKYEKIVANGGWPVVPEGRLMRVNESDERVPILRRRLRISGDLPKSTRYYSSEEFDSELEEALKRFQTRHGLRPTGRMDRSVYSHVNITAAERLAQLRLNLQRLQGLAGNADGRYIFVNVPAFQLEAVSNYEVVQRHRVIVGKPDRQTPDISTLIRGLNFFPEWRVPESVAKLDLIPRLRTEPQYLVEEGIRVFDGYLGPELDRSTINWSDPVVAKYWFKQDSGERNALGLVRIDMSNEHNVYMHDTPLKSLFGQRSRSFSAGCVRVEDVFDLVDWIANEEMGWGKKGQAQAVVAGGQPLTVQLTRPVPVVFGYVTAWAEPRSGLIQFRPDIYGRDGSARRNHIPDEEAGAATAAAAQILAP